MKHYVIIKAKEVTSEMLRLSGVSRIEDAVASFDGKIVALSFEHKNHAAFLGLKWIKKDKALKIVNGQRFTGKGFFGFFYRIFL
jgi:hypothetical protein